MRRETAGTLLLVIGIVFVRLAWSGAYASYVKVGLRWPLLASALVLAVAGALTLWRGQDEPALADEHLGHGGDGEPGGADASRGPVDDEHAGHAHAGVAPRTGALLLVPVVVLLLVAPAPLGADAAQRARANASIQGVSAVLPPLPEQVDGAVPLGLQGTILRTVFVDDGGLEEVPLRLTGFVVHDPERAPDGYLLSRFTLSCCAADASLLQVAVATTDVPADDTWVEVVAVWRGRVDDPSLPPSQRLPILEVVEQREVPQPAEPYEY
ncbi:MAG: TIGR03943 family putative permease subunit [Actinomycetes bacterium]